MAPDTIEGYKYTSYMNSVEPERDGGEWLRKSHYKWYNDIMIIFMAMVSTHGELRLVR